MRKKRDLWISSVLGIVVCVATILTATKALANGNGGGQLPGYPYCCCTCGTGNVTVCDGYYGAWNLMTGVCEFFDQDPDHACELTNSQAGCSS